MGTKRLGKGKVNTEERRKMILLVNLHFGQNILPRTDAVSCLVYDQTFYVGEGVEGGGGAAVAERMRTDKTTAVFCSRPLVFERCQSDNLSLLFT